MRLYVPAAPAVDDVVLVALQEVETVVESLHPVSVGRRDRPGSRRPRRRRLAGVVVDAAGGVAGGRDSGAAGAAAAVARRTRGRRVQQFEDASRRGAAMLYGQSYSFDPKAFSDKSRSILLDTLLEGSAAETRTRICSCCWSNSS